MVDGMGHVPRIHLAIRRDDSTGHTPMVKLRALAILWLVALNALASEPPLWQGHEFQEVRSLSALPAAIQHQLDVRGGGTSGVAEMGQPFNISDVTDPHLPMRRLLVAGHDGDRWIVALEQGGRGYSIQVFLFVKNEQRDHWALLTRPTSLQQVLDQIPTKRPDSGRD